MLMPRRARNPAAGLAKNRLEAVVDGITGFVLTVLVFDITVPAVGHDASSLPALLWAEREPLFTFLITAAVIATFWLGHAHQMNFITRVDRTLAWTNFAGLALVVLLPFTTSLLGRYLWVALPTAIYGANVALIGVAGLVQWRWAARGRHLLREDAPPEVVRDFTRRIVLGVTLALLGVAAAFVLPALAMLLYALAFLPFAFRSLVDDSLKHE